MQRRLYDVMRYVGHYGWWQAISLIYTIGLGCAAIGDDLSSVTVPLLRWRALVLCGFAYSGVFAVGWAIGLMRMINRDVFHLHFESRVTSANKRLLLASTRVLDAPLERMKIANSVWYQTAAISGMQLFYYVAMFLVYGMASTYSVFIYTYTDDSNVDSIQNAIDQGYSKGAEFMSYAVHKKISMLVWLQIAMLVSVCLSLACALLARFEAKNKVLENVIETYNFETFVKPMTETELEDYKAELENRNRTSKDPNSTEASTKKRAARTSSQSANGGPKFTALQEISSPKE